MQRHVLACFFLIILYLCVGKVPVTSLTFRNSRGGPTYIIQEGGGGGGGGASNFYPRGWSPIAKR